MTVMQTNVAEFPCKRGKVRDVYDIGNKLVIVATDRISAFDWVMPNGIPNKGKILTAITRFWFEFLRDAGVVNFSHFITDDIKEMPEPFRRHPEIFAGRSMLVRKAKVIPLECIVRGYITGSGYSEYRKTGKLCGHVLPHGLQDSMPLFNPLFTPSTKAETGHDENVDLKTAVEIVGSYEAVEGLNGVMQQSLRIYKAAAAYAWQRGIILADTKFEFGYYGERTNPERPSDNIILIDEVLTPDSSRYWPVADYCVGESPLSLDKQFVRDYLKSTSWDKNSPPPELPKDVVQRTQEKYEEIYNILTRS